MADYQTSFDEFADQTSADAEWPSNDTAQSRVDIVNDLIDFASINDQTNDSIAKDLQDQNALGSGNNLSNTAWIARFKVNVVTLTQSTAVTKYLMIGFSDGDETVGRNDNQDSIFAWFFINTTTGNSAWSTGDSDGGVMGGDSAGSTAVTTQAYYLQLVRLTSTTYEVNVYSDSAFSSLIETITGTCASTTQSLRYFVIRNRNDAGQQTSGTIVVEVDEIRVVNGETSWPQFARPDGDQSVGNWKDEGDATTNLYQSIDEEFPIYTDYVKSEDSPSASAYQVTLSNVTDPAKSTGHKVRYFFAKDNDNQTINLTIRLKQGATTIASATHNGITTTITKGSFTLSGAEADNITDYTDLRVEFEATAA